MTNKENLAKAAVSLEQARTALFGFDCEDMEININVSWARREVAGITKGLKRAHLDVSALGKEPTKTCPSQMYS